MQKNPLFAYDIRGKHEKIFNISILHTEMADVD